MPLHATHHLQLRIPPSSSETVTIYICQSGAAESLSERHTLAPYSTSTLLLLLTIKLLQLQLLQLLCDAIIHPSLGTRHLCQILKIHFVSSV